MGKYNRIYLVGMPGSGKSTEGKKLAKALGWHFLDLDAMIENETGENISEIFERKGELYFRELEKDALAKTFEMKETVIACGGGTPAYENNMDLIQKNGLSVYLKTSASFILSRLESGNRHRPMFKGLDKNEILAKIQEILGLRKPFYERATLVWDLPPKKVKSLSDVALEHIST